MDRIKQQPISSILGLFLFFGGFTLLWVETNYELPLYVLGIMIVGGVLLLFAKDKFLDILTLGFSRLVQDGVDKVKK